MARIGFLGTGEIAAVLVETLAGQGHEILVSTRNADRAQDLCERFPEVRVCANKALVAGSELVVVCLLPPVARQILGSLPFRAEQRLVSVMTDISCAELATLCAPVGSVARMIPLPTLKGGQSPLACYPDHPDIRRLFAGQALILPTPDEAALNSLFVASALLLPVLDQLDAAAHWLSGRIGGERVAEQYLIRLFGSYFDRLAQDPAPGFNTVRAELNTEGGLNQTLSKRMAEAGTPEILVEGLEILMHRLKAA